MESEGKGGGEVGECERYGNRLDLTYSSLLNTMGLNRTLVSGTTWFKGKIIRDGAIVGQPAVDADVHMGLGDGDERIGNPALHKSTRIRLTAWQTRVDQTIT